MAEGAINIAFSGSTADGPTLRLLVRPDDGLPLLREVFQRLRASPWCMSLTEVADVATDNVDVLRLESVADGVPASGQVVRFGAASFEWVGTLDDWDARASLLDGLTGSPGRFQYFDYERPSAVAVVVEVAGER